MLSEADYSGNILTVISVYLLYFCTEYHIITPDVKLTVMRHIAAITAVFTATSALSAEIPDGQFSADKTLWYTAPASQWEETLPLGNGRLGMMPYGNPFHEKIVLNEISMWSGSKASYDNPAAAESLPEIQRLLMEGKNLEAQELMYSTFVPTKTTDLGTYGSYQMLADLDIDLSYPSTDVTGYLRWLDLQEAVATTSYTIGGVKYVAECVVPRGENVMIYHIKGSLPASVSFTASLHRKENATAGSAGGGMIMLSGMLESGQPGVDGVKYAAVAGVRALGDNALSSATDSTLSVTDADEAYIIVGAATSYLNGAMYMTDAINDVSAALRLGDIELLHRLGTERHRALFDRASVTLPEGKIAHLPTNERIELFQTESDPSLAALYYNYGRYLLISSTHPGSLPPNLQGLWANDVVTPWNGDYHTNINVQMNHWGAEPGNLSELHLPLVDLVKRAVPNGRHTAKVFYGSSAKGWVMHMMTNPWEYTDPGEHPSWGATNTGGAWLCAHLWEHYLYTGDSLYLAEIYPIMKGAAEFFKSTMIKEPSHGWLVTAPSSSPENTFFAADSVTPISVVMGPAMDTQLIRELYTNTIDAATRLGVDKQFADSLEADLALLPPHLTGSDGRLMEWLEEYRETDPHHRHVSHLYALHPGNQISVVNTPELADAARKTLDRRGDGGTGWSRAWKVNFWARLGDGNRAYSLFKSLLVPAYTAEKPHHDAGTFPNLFCSHPPFQMDGNWGGAAGIGEMLLQSQDGFINPLPALPDEWRSGAIHGFKVRGGAEVDMDWTDGKVSRIIITGGFSPETKIKIPAGTRKITVNGSSYPLDEYLTLPLKKGERAEILLD